METSIIWLPRARNALFSIYHYIADDQHNKAAAGKIMDKMWKSAESLRNFPKLGLIEPALKSQSKEYRSLIVEKRYKIIYTIKNETTIEIMPLWDCHRNSENLSRQI